MAAYVKLTNFAVKDGLLSGNPLKIVTGAELDDEFNAIASASSLNYTTIDAAVAAAFVKWNMESSTTMADPSSGGIRLNNASAASVTAIAIDDLNNGGSNVSAFVTSWDDSTGSTNKGTLMLRSGSTFAIYSVTGLTDNVGWTQLAVTYQSGSGTFTSGSEVYVAFYRTGEASADVTTVAGIAANVTTVAGIAANVTTVAGIAADVTAVAADAADIGTVAAANANIGTVATNIANVNTVAGNNANVTTVAGIAADITTVAADATDIGTVAAANTNIGTVVTNIANVNTVAGNNANVTTVAGISADVTTVAGISSSVSTVAGVASDVLAVAAQFIGWNFSTTTTMADPGSGTMRFNNATLASVTAIALDDLNSASADVSAYVLTWDDSSNTIKGTLTIRQGTANYAIFSVTGLTDNVGWTELAVTHVSSSGTFSNDVLTFVGFDRTGDAGTGKVTLTQPATGATLTLADNSTLTTSGAYSWQFTVPGAYTYTLPSSTCSFVPAGTITSSGLTMATARILGRSTASSGAVEEISIGTGLTLSAGTLSSSASSDIVKLTTATANASASLDFTASIDSTYKKYVIELSNIVLSDAVRLLFRASVDGGSSWLTSGSYRDQLIYAYSSNQLESAGTNSDNMLRITASNYDTTKTDDSLSAVVEITNPSATGYKQIIFRAEFPFATGGMNVVFGGGVVIGSTSAINAFRILPGAGTITSGTAILYGVK